MTTYSNKRTNPLPVTAPRTPSTATSSSSNTQVTSGGTANPITTTKAQTPAGLQFLQGLNGPLSAAIQAALRDLQAQYTAQRTAGTGQLSAIKAALADALSVNSTGRDRSVDNVQRSAAGRGFFDSGVRRGDQARTVGDYARQAGQLRTQSGIDQSAIQAILDQIAPNEARSSLESVAGLLTAQSDADTRLATNGLLVDSGDFSGQITVEDIRAFLASLQ